jgi:hypothetical protein
MSQRSSQLSNRDNNLSVSCAISLLANTNKLCEVFCIGRVIAQKDIPYGFAGAFRHSLCQ